MQAQGAGHGEKKSRKMEIAVIALLTEQTVGKAAEKAGVSDKTMFRWMQDSDFQDMFREAKRQAVGQAISRLQQATTLAVDTLMGVMTNKRSPAMAKVLAAKATLEMAMKAVELEDLEARIAALERNADDD